MKKILTLVLGILSLSLFSQTATVTLSSEKQIIRGFGGINHPIWYSDLNASERDLCFGNGAGQMGLTVLRIWVSDNTSQWALELPTAKRAVALGATVFATPWNPPASMTITVNGKKRINPASYAAYAKHLNDFVLYMRANGVELYSISVQNEPDYAAEWTEWSPQEGVDFIKGYADQIDCRLMTPESFQYRKQVYDPILNDPLALSKVDIFGTHLYGTQVSAFPYPLFKQKGAGKELWMTEVYTDSKSDANLWDLALDAAVHIHNAMVEGEFQAYVWWPLRRYYALIHDGNGGHNNPTVAAAGTVTKRGFVFAQFSKFVRPGYVRVDATKSPTTDVYVSAYKKGDDVVIVAVNKGTSAKTITISVPNTKVTTWEKYVTSSSKNVVKETNSTGTSFQITLDAQSVTTFNGIAPQGGKAPTVSLTSPTNNASYTTAQTISLVASANDADGKITNVKFYQGTTLLSTDATDPYAFDWKGMPAGNYSITAVVTDDSGLSTTSSPIAIKVNVVRSPYNGAISQIPGKIEFEEYDLGGNGIAYMDDSPGSAVTPVVNFRTSEDVDIETCTDLGGGYNIGYGTAGEWLEYTVNVQATDKYDIDLRVACNGDARTLSMTMDGNSIANAVAIPNTAGWQTWTTVSLKNVQLSAGQHILRMTIGATSYINLNFVEFKRVVTGTEEVLEANSVLSFPNPFTEQFQLDVEGTYKYEVYDALGVLQSSGNGENEVFLGSELEKGTYLVKIIKDQAISSLKVIKQ
jgi:O-glycosyl hydrolase